MIYAHSLFVVLVLAVSLLHGVDASNYKLTIKMDATTLTKMKEERMNMYLFKGVQTKMNVMPTVWTALSSFLETTTIGWTEQYNAFISNNEARSGVTIDSITSAPMNSGQLAAIDASGFGTLTVTNNPSVPSDTYAILNQAKTSFTVGLSQASNGVETTICAAPLYGNNLANIIPIERVFIMFASDWLNTGTVLTQTLSSGLLLDMTQNNAIEVSYDYNKAWDAAGASYATTVPALSDFSSFLNTK